MNEPLVSVIMSTKDTEKYMLEESIDSILNQTYKNLEFVIVCDGSVQDYEVIKRYSDARIKIIKHETSIGLTKSLNECLRIAKGKYIARMDSDDIAKKNRLQVEVKFLEKNKNIGICSTFAQYIGNRKGFLIDTFNRPQEKKAELLIYNNIVHSGVMIRKKFLIDNNLQYDENYKYSQDYELWTRCCSITDIAVIPKICMKYRVHNTQISTSKREEQNELCRNIFTKQIEKLGLDDVEKKVEMIFYLSKKSKKQYDNQEIVEFIKEVINKNDLQKNYDKKALSKILYYRYFVMKHKELPILKKALVLCKFNALELITKKILYTLIGMI